MIRLMPFKLSAMLSMTAAIFKDRADLVAENWAAIFARYSPSLGHPIWEKWAETTDLALA